MIETSEGERGRRPPHSVYFADNVAKGLRACSNELITAHPPELWLEHTLITLHRQTITLEWTSQSWPATVNTDAAEEEATQGGEGDVFLK